MSGAKILLIGSEPLFRGAVGKFLGTLSNVARVEEAGEIAEAVEKSKELQPDLVLLDVAVRENAMFQAIAEIRRVAPACQIAVLTHHMDADAICGAVKHGANSYIHKKLHPDTLLEIVKLLLEGTAVLSPEAAGVLLEKMRVILPGSASERCQVVKLSPQQKKVLELLEQGLSNKEIAAALSISPNTVKNHIQNIFKKFMVDNRTCAVSRALNWGVLKKGEAGGEGMVNLDDGSGA